MTKPRLAARAARSLRFLRSLRGWRRTATWLAGREGDFSVDNAGVKFAGSLSSYLDRQVYLFGGYETEMIRLFIEAAPRKGTILDIGANAGNHSMFFAKAFDRVLAFEPHPKLWDQFERNAALNRATNVTLHRVGLADEAGDLPLFDVECDNKGMATFSPAEQYDRPLERSGSGRVEVADHYLGNIPVDAVKIDVQGFEPHVLKGMRRILERNRPMVWTEISIGTLEQVRSADDLRALFPYPVHLRRFETCLRGLLRTSRLTRDVKTPLESGNYLILPADPVAER